MMVWHLAFLVCGTITFPLGDGAYTKTCRWQADGGLYASEAACRRHGEKQIGTPVWSDSDDGSHPTRTMVRCRPQSVIE